MDEIKLPKLLECPQKLIPVILRLNEFRYFLIKGGRGGGKSQFVARLLLYISEHHENLRIFCGRETQNTIEESVYTLFKDLIREFCLDLDVGANKIDHRRTHTAIRFKGFREQGNINIKGLEGVDILWVEEAQAITKATLDIIIPTIRKNKAKIFFTMNETLPDDAVVVQFANRPDCLTIHINYDENPFCPKALIDESEQCRLRNIDDYKHIWLGHPRDQATNAAFRGVRDVVGDYLHPEEPVVGFDYVIGGDLARSVDYSVFAVLCVQTKRFVCVERMESEKRTSWNYQKERILALTQRYNNALFVGDSTGVGDPIVEDLQRMGVKVWYSREDTPGLKFTSISKENIVERLKIAVELRMIELPRIEWLIKELEIFEATILPSRNYRYAAPVGKHDDGVFAVALALWGIRSDVYEQWKPAKPKTLQEVKTDEFWDRVKKSTKKREDEEIFEEDEGALIEG